MLLHRVSFFRLRLLPSRMKIFLSDCHYEITIPNPAKPIRAVWVIFDRGRDMLRYYGDPEIQAFAYRKDLGLLFPFHCRAKAYEDMDVDPSTGNGRALFTALSRFSQPSGHQELASAKLILLGFSGPGSLVARLTTYAPDRVMAAILADPGHFDPLGMDTVKLSSEALAVPQLIFTGSTDTHSGTKRPYEYFRKYFDQGAPWAFVIQNKTPHCCIINAKKLILLWTEAILEERPSFNGTLRRVDARKGWSTFMATRETETKDTWGEKTSELTDAKIQRGGKRPPEGMIPAGWLPNRRVAALTIEALPARVTAPVTMMPPAASEMLWAWTGVTNSNQLNSPDSSPAASVFPNFLFLTISASRFFLND